MRSAVCLARFLPAAVCLLLSAAFAQAQTVTATIGVGTSPQAVAVNPVTNKVYVANWSSGTVTVIDGATNSTTTVNTGSNPNAIAVNPATNKIYLANEGSSNVTVIDGTTNLTTTVAAGIKPWAIALNPITNKVYVSNGGSNTVTVIDGNTNSTTTISVGLGPWAVAVNPATNKIYVANYASNDVTVIDGVTNSTTTVNAGSYPQAVAVNPVTNKIYVANYSSNNVTVIDGATNAASIIGAGSGPFSIATNPVTNEVYVANSGSNDLIVVEGNTNATTTIAVGTQPYSVAVNSMTNQIYIGNNGSANITVIDGASGRATVLADSAARAPYALGVNPVTNKIYALNNNSNNVSVIDGTTYSTRTIACGLTPSAAVINPVTNKIYVANYAFSSVTVIDAVTNSTIIVTDPSGGYVSALAVNPITNKIYVAHSNTSNLTVIDGASNAITTIASSSYPQAVAVNSVTNQIYVSNPIGITVIDGVSNATTTVPDWGGFDYRPVAVNEVTNRVYVTNQQMGSITVMDGSTKSINSVATGWSPELMAVNQATNRIYIAGSGGQLIVIDGLSNSIIPISVAFSASAIAVNAVTNQIYVAIPGNGITEGSVAIIDGATNRTTLIADPNASSSASVAVNQTNNRIYIAYRYGRNVTVLDGITNYVTTLLAGNYTYAVAANPVTGSIYVTNYEDGTVTAFSDGTQRLPLHASIGALPGNATPNSEPAFVFTATSGFTPLTPPVDNLFYQVDTRTAPWMTASLQSPGTFAGSTGPLSPGYHILYAYVSDGQEGTSTNTGSQSSPFVGNITGYGFLVTKATPRASLTGAPTTAPYLSTFTVTASTNASTAPTITASGVCTIVGNTVTMNSGSGICQVTASWAGDANYLPTFITTSTAAVKQITATAIQSVLAPYSVSSQLVALSATLGAQAGLVNDGTVSFTVSNGTQTVGSPVISGTVTNGTAMVNYELPGNTPPATYLIQATYSGTANFTTSSDSTHTLTVATVPGALTFIPVTPCRVADTRNPTGPFGGLDLSAGTSRTFVIPSSACGIPSTAAAYSLNVTAVPDAQLNYLTIWPSGQQQPYVSTLNSDGRIKANAAIVPAGTNGAVSVYATDNTQVILDIDGYFAPVGTSSALALYPLVPCRIADTRQGGLPFGAPSLIGGESRSFPMLESSCNIPTAAQAYSFNITAVPHNTLGYLTTWPTGQAQPYVSTLNASTGEVTANAAIVPAGTNGNISIYVSEASDVIIDINGYFAPPGAGGLWLYPVTPCRVLDTRSSSGQFNGTLPVNVVASACGAPSVAKVFVLNATVVPPGPLTYLALWPDGQPQPLVSTLNAFDAAITSNMAIVPTTNGSIDAFGSNPTQLIFDLSAYFAP